MSLWPYTPQWHERRGARIAIKKIIRVCLENFLSWPDLLPRTWVNGQTQDFWFKRASWLGWELFSTSLLMHDGQTFHFNYFQKTYISSSKTCFFKKNISVSNNFVKYLKDFMPCQYLINNELFHFDNVGREDTTWFQWENERKK